MTESPRTEAGRRLMDLYIAEEEVPGQLDWLRMRQSVLAIEAEAAAAPLDLERLRRALRERYGYTHPHADVVARQVAEAYARLQASAPPLDPEQTP